MPSRDAIEGFREGNARLTALVQAELESYFRTLDLTNPAGVRDALIAYVPILVETFGEVAQQLAMEWYDLMRFEADPATAFRAIAPPLPDLAPKVEGSIRYAAGHLFRGEPEKALKDISENTQKYVLQPGRDTMFFNAVQEGVYWARVPQGAETCSFCLLLASRSFDYLSEQSAGSEEYGEDNKFHKKCDCLIVPSDEGYPEGYIPDDLYEIYGESAKVVGGTDFLELILYDYRRRNPAVDDFVDDPAYLENPDAFLPQVRAELEEARRKKRGRRQR